MEVVRAQILEESALEYCINEIREVFNETLYLSIERYTI